MFKHTCKCGNTTFKLYESLHPFALCATCYARHEIIITGTPRDRSAQMFLIPADSMCELTSDQ